MLAPSQRSLPAASSRWPATAKVLPQPSLLPCQPVNKLPSSHPAPTLSFSHSLVSRIQARDVGFDAIETIFGIADLGRPQLWRRRRPTRRPRRWQDHMTHVT
ncbi:hypothetical protein BT93_B1436 [Corymbia citriodora subsp. variegata]|nr:hypothetical protein BT93_B1436 [Corymbia citriodora subsp. variegata]